MAKTTDKNGDATLPGTIYSRNGRYWYKVQLPGETRPVARPLKAAGSKFATADYSAAVALANTLYQQAIFNSHIDISKVTVSNIAALTAAYLAYADQYYRNDTGHPNNEAVNMRYSLKPLTDLFAGLSINEFGPLRLIEVREHMIRLNWSRNLINHRINRIRRMFKWAVSRQLISPLIYQGLMTIDGLKRGRSAARETEKRRPVEEKHIMAVLSYTTPVIAAMIELQLLTGMRPGELFILRPCALDRSGAVWHYYPERHKNRYRSIERIISIGPRGQEILRPFLLRLAETYCFSPAESERQRRGKMSMERKTPLSCGNVPGSGVKDNPKCKPGEVYNVMAYGKAVRHAIIAARKAIQSCGGNPDRELPYWTPYQMRHTAATKVRREMGYETAGATLGHTNMSATAIYAERNQGLADEAARRLG